MGSDELNQIFIAEDTKTKQPYKPYTLSDSDLCKHSIIVDSVGSTMHSKVLSKIFDHQITQQSPLMLIQYKADHNKDLLHSATNRLGLSAYYTNLNDVPPEFMQETIRHAVQSRNIVYADLKEGKTEFYDYLMDLLPSVVSRTNTKQPLHIIITQFNQFNDGYWERLIRVARRANIRLTFVYDHYPDVIKTPVFSQQAIIHNCYTHFIFKQNDKSLDLVNSDFNLLNHPTNIISRIIYFFTDRKNELKYLKPNECLVRKNMVLSKIKF